MSEQTQKDLDYGQVAHNRGTHSECSVALPPAGITQIEFLRVSDCFSACMAPLAPNDSIASNVARSVALVNLQWVMRRLPSCLG
jgi:hypothetical protein